VLCKLTQVDSGQAHFLAAKAKKCLRRLARTPRHRNCILGRKTKGTQLGKYNRASREPNLPHEGVKIAPQYILRLSQRVLRLSGRSSGRAQDTHPHFPHALLDSTRKSVASCSGQQQAVKPIELLAGPW
jgi:hypothetical protein